MSFLDSWEDGLAFIALMALLPYPDAPIGMVMSSAEKLPVYYFSADLLESL